jgi:hypothetical protein
MAIAMSSFFPRPYSTPESQLSFQYMSVFLAGVITAAYRHDVAAKVTQESLVVGAANGLIVRA